MSTITVFENQVDDQDFFPVEDFSGKMSDALRNAPLDKEGVLVFATVRSIDRKKGVVCLDAGLKSESFIFLNEFFLEGEADSIAVGDIVEVYLHKIDDRKVVTKLSRAYAIRERSWEELLKARENQTEVFGIAFSKVKGGVSVDFRGIISFLPGSQIDIRPVRDISNVVGKKVAYKILNVEENKKTGVKSAVVSRKDILESEKSADREDFLDSVHEGDIVTGIVKNITNYGAFVDLGAVDGLLHVTDIAWEKISHPSEVLNVGDSIRVKIIKYDRDGKRLSLGMKQLLDNPWSSLKDKYPPGKVIKGKVLNITSYGAFIQVENGVEGLLHLSEMSWTKDSHKKHRELEIGDELEVMVLEVDIEKHRMALSLKKMTENPWERFVSSYKVGDIIDGVVRNVTDFGIFVGVDGFDVDGLIHVSDISWNKDENWVPTSYKKNDPIRVVYLGSEVENQRIKLGIKQLNEDPFDKLKDRIKEGTVVTCKVLQVKADGIYVELFEDFGTRIFIKRSNLSRDKVEQRSDRFVVGDKVDAKVVSFDPALKTVILSIKALEEDEHGKAIEKYGSVDVGATIGSVLGDAIEIANNKQEDEG